MILTFPTGFYKTVLPPAPGNEMNVTYVISDGPPPRGALFYLKITSSLALASNPIIATEPQGDINSGILKSYRNNTTIDREPRPIGSVLEFTDAYKTLDAQTDPLNEVVNFPRFNNPSTDPVNLKLVEAYEKFQSELLDVAQQSISKQVEIENLERSTNTAISSLQATEEALKAFPDDEDLLAVQDDLQSQIDQNGILVDLLVTEVETLDSQKADLTDSIRRLSKVIQ